MRRDVSKLYERINNVKAKVRRVSSRLFGGESQLLCAIRVASNGNLEGQSGLEDNLETRRRQIREFTSSWYIVCLQNSIKIVAELLVVDSFAGGEGQGMKG